MASKFATTIRNYLDVSSLKPGSASPLSGSMKGILQAFKTVFEVPALAPVRSLRAEARMPTARMIQKNTPRFGKPKNIWE